jgi:hypothetical protein
VEVLELPAFASLNAGEGWDVDQLQLGNDGLWHFRGVRKDREMGERNYYTAVDLSAAPEASSVGAFQNGARPRSLDTAPPGLAGVLDSLSALFGGGTFVVKVFSSQWPMPRFYASSAVSLSGEVLEFLAYWDDQGVWALAPDGRGYWAAPGGTLGEFSLPGLPESYRYTGLVLLGENFIALWEEQDGLLVGAAGFMVLGPAYGGLSR